MAQTPAENGPSKRVARHRARMVSSGARRVEVTVPAGDAALVREVAGLLRSGGVKARQVRKAMAPLLSRHQARTGAELVAFLRGSPVADEGAVDFDGVRDRSAGRVADLE